MASPEPVEPVAGTVAVRRRNEAQERRGLEPVLAVRTAASRASEGLVEPVAVPSGSHPLVRPVEPMRQVEAAVRQNRRFDHLTVR